MHTRIATALAEGSTEKASETLIAALQQKLEGAAPVLVSVFASTTQRLDVIQRQLKAAFPKASILGSSTAGEFTEERDAKGSVSAFALAGDFKVFAGMSSGLKKDVESAVQRALGEGPSEIAGYPHRTAILMLDPLSGNGEEATLIAAGLLGADTPLVGGAAGDDLKMSETCVGLDGTVSSDSVVAAVLFSKAPLGVGVCHGHELLGPPMKVTRAEGNVVHEVDGRPAWDVWVETTRAAAAKSNRDPDTLGPEEVGAYLLTYEAGLDTGASELKIRAPLSKSPAGALSFACGIPEGATIRITESIPQRQVESARKAARRAREKMNDGAVAGALVFDCICRNLILGSEFHTAVKGISEELGGAPLAGYETYGEIALAAGDMSGFHNTTTVVLAFPR
jgi:methyl-accepting chemotaxis protein